VNILRRFQPILYIRLDPNTLSIRDVRSGRTVAEPPLAAISRGPKIALVAVGEAARAAAASPSVELVNPFKHPRTLLSDFTVAEQVIQGFVRKLLGSRPFLLSPIVVLHPKVDPEGGFTQIELRALRELAVGAGAAQVFIRAGRDLTDEEVLNLRLDSGGQVLES